MAVMNDATLLYSNRTHDSLNINLTISASTEADLTFLSSLTGCSGISGLSLQPGRRYSEGLMSKKGLLFPTPSIPEMNV